MSEKTKAEALLSRLSEVVVPFRPKTRPGGDFRVGDRVRTPDGPGNVVDSAGDEVAVKLDRAGEKAFDRSELSNLSRDE
jgi:hypothetical protein